MAARLVAAQVPLDRSRLYNVYRLLLIHEDPSALEQRDLQEYGSRSARILHVLGAVTAAAQRR